MLPRYICLWGVVNAAVIFIATSADADRHGVLLCAFLLNVAIAASALIILSRPVKPQDQTGLALYVCSAYALAELPWLHSWSLVWLMISALLVLLVAFGAEPPHIPHRKPPRSFPSAVIAAGAGGMIPVWLLAYREHVGLGWIVGIPLGLLVLSEVLAYHPSDHTVTWHQDMSRR